MKSIYDIRIERSKINNSIYINDEFVLNFEDYNYELIREFLEFFEDKFSIPVIEQSIGEILDEEFENEIDYNLY